DSIKIPNATPKIIEQVIEFGNQYGYDFEHETTYNRMCLVNDAVYIALKDDGKWEAVGAQFQHPYVYKTLFSHEKVEFDDLCETKSVTTALYLDFADTMAHKYDSQTNPVFVGKVGRFVPIREGCGGALLMR